jgi:hemoglobin-like flavoprotein
MITARQKLLIVGSWELMRPVSTHVADVFYDRLFELDPLLEERFPEDSSVQRSRFVNAIAEAIDCIDDIEGLRSLLQDLGHPGIRGFDRGNEVTLGNALLWTFEQTLAEDFTPPVRDAWAALCPAFSSALDAEVQESVTPRAQTGVRDLMEVRRPQCGRRAVGI